MNDILQQDPEVWSAIHGELQRQQDGLEMIASENYASPAVLQAAGSVLTNKYAEGYPGRRYYGGCEFVDQVENLARTRAKQLFSADHANVQPHSGSQANSAVYMAFIQPGDTVLGLDLAHGGHLTHGMKLNSSGKLYQFVRYGVSRDTHRIDFDQIASLAREHRPKLIVAGASAYPREIQHDRFAEIAEEVGAKLFVDMAHYAGLVAAGLHHNPVSVADIVSTTTHKTLRGPRGGLVLCRSEYAKDRHPRRTADACHCRKSCLFCRSTAARLQAICAANRRKCQDIGRGVNWWQFESGQWWDRQPSDARRRDATRHWWKDRRTESGSMWYHRQ